MTHPKEEHREYMRKWRMNRCVSYFAHVNRLPALTRAIEIRDLYQQECQNSQNILNALRAGSANKQRRQIESAKRYTQ